jgi:uncharacterized damage-inducible protein DinB
METSMPLAQALIPEIDHEVGLTSQLIACIPEAQAAWKPHAKSMSLGGLAVHLTDCMQWGSDTMSSTGFDIAPVGGPAWTPAVFVSVAATQAALQANTAAFKQALLGASDADFMVMWSLKKGGTDMFTLPRIGVLRSMILNHHIHHRGQLTVYLRLLDVALPMTYGPSADMGG